MLGALQAPSGCSSSLHLMHQGVAAHHTTKMVLSSQQLSMTLLFADAAVCRTCMQHTPTEGLISQTRVQNYLPITAKPDSWLDGVAYVHT